MTEDTTEINEGFRRLVAPDNEALGTGVTREV